MYLNSLNTANIDMSGDVCFVMIELQLIPSLYQLIVVYFPVEESSKVFSRKRRYVSSHGPKHNANT